MYFLKYFLIFAIIVNFSHQVFYMPDTITNAIIATQNICVCNDLSRIEICNSTKKRRIKNKLCNEPHILKCTDDTSRLKIIKAVYGLIDYEICPTDASIYTKRRVCDETLTATDIVSSKCNGRISCAITLKEQFVDYCPCDPFKYLQIIYSCDELVIPNAPLSGYFSEET